MIDLAGLPVPDDAPEPGSCVRIERPEDGLVRLVLDPPHRPKMAVFDVPLLRDLDSAIDRIAREGDVRGLVITGRDPLSFAAGADVETIVQVTDPALAQRFAREGQELFQRLHKLGRDGGGRISTVAAVGGPVPGGACELTLACDRIVLADHPKTRIGLPEVRLGIFPAWGGSQRLPRRIGVTKALGAILTGRLYDARRAYKLGMVDRLTHPEYLLAVADEIAMRRERCPRRGAGGLGKVLVDKNPLGAAFVARKARENVLKETKGNYPAPLAVLPLVVRAPRISLAEGLKAEIEAILPLTTSPTSKNLIQIFLASEAAKKLARLPEELGGGRAEDFRRAAVIGGGVMGGAIASILAEKGLPTRLRDLDRGAVDAALVDHQEEIAKKRKRRRLTGHAADAALDRLQGTTGPEGFGGCDFVIEAVAERLEVKRAVLGELAGLAEPGAVLATNTSSLSVAAIAEEIPDPERVVGMHFFNPVRRMPLVEIVRGPRTSTEVVARTAGLAVALGKTPVVTKDVPGFLVNRVLGPYLDEAVRLVEAGCDPYTIDRALVDFGMPMGPCELIDEVGLDIAAHAAASLEAGYGERMRPSQALQPLVEAGELGKKTGAGIYLWRKKERGGKPENAGANPRLSRRSDGLGLSDPAIVDRLVLAMVNESARAMAEEVVAIPRELDLATVFGTGFAPFRGGVLRYADTRGAVEVTGKLRDLLHAPDVSDSGERLGRFEPAEILAEQASAGGSFHGS